MEPKKKYPSRDDEPMGELFVMERMAHALIVGMFDCQPHEMGHSLKALQAVTHDMSFLAEGLYNQYLDAKEKEDAKRLLSE